MVWWGTQSLHRLHENTDGKRRRKGMRKEGGKERRERKKGKSRRGVKDSGLNLVLG